MPIRPPRTFLSRGSGSETRSTGPAGESSRIDPDSITPGAATSRRIDIAVTLLPQPLSPTSPSVRPGSMASETPSTAGTRPVGVWNAVTRFRMSRSGIAYFRASRSRGSVDSWRPSPIRL